MHSIDFYRRHNYKSPASAVLLIALIAAGTVHATFAHAQVDANWLTYWLVRLDVTAALLLGFGCLLTLLVQALNTKLNRSPILPGVVLLYATWTVWTVMHSHDMPATFWPYTHGVMTALAIAFDAVLPVIGALLALSALAMLAMRRPTNLKAYGYSQFYSADPKLIESLKPKRTVAKAVPANLAAGQAQQEATAKYRYPAVSPKVTFASLYGNDELKESLLGAGREWREESKNGILLSGSPGTGKTVFAEALAAELGLGFMKVTFGDVASKWINQSTEQMVLAFTEAMAQQPVMLFIDEVDSLLKSRDAGHNYEEYERMVTTFLDKAVALRGTNVLLVAATNYLDRLDDAAIREGRFDFKIEVPLPDAAARRGLLTTGLEKMHCATDTETMDRLTRRWGGFNVPRLIDCAEGAAKLARADAGRSEFPGNQEPNAPVSVVFDHFYRALRKIQGRKGGAPEGAKRLSEMFLDREIADKLASLATQLVDVDKVERLGGSLPKGVLFCGLPGTGKTATAMALARECGWSFITRTGRELLADGAVDKLAKEASDLRPAIVFLDEADDILGDRRGSPYKAATNELLVLIDGANGMLHDVVWVAATNNPESMDTAARRGGRFGQKIEFGPPSEATAMRLIMDWVIRKRADKSIKIAVPADQWATQVYPALRGLTPSDVYQALESANNTAITDNLRKHTSRTVTAAHVKQAVADLKG